jgi:hypothetical protein
MGVYSVTAEGLAGTNIPAFIQEGESVDLEVLSATESSWAEGSAYTQIGESSNPDLILKRAALVLDEWVTVVDSPPPGQLRILGLIAGGSPGAITNTGDDSAEIEFQVVDTNSGIIVDGGSRSVSAHTLDGVFGSFVLREGQVAQAKQTSGTDGALVSMASVNQVLDPGISE